MSIEKIELKMALRSLRQRELTGKGSIRAPSLALEHAPCLIVRIIRASRRLRRGPRRDRYGLCKSLKWLTDEVTAAIINLAFAFWTPRDARTCLLVLSGEARGIDFGKLGWVMPTLVPVILLRRPPIDVSFGTYRDSAWQRLDGEVQSVVVTGNRWPVLHRDEDGVDIYGDYTADEWSMSEDDAHSETFTIDSNDALSDSAVSEDPA